MSRHYFKISAQASSIGKWALIIDADLQFLLIIRRETASKEVASAQLKKNKSWELTLHKRLFLNMLQRP
jgi:hypothetical protein